MPPSYQLAYMGVSENSVPLNPMVLLIIIPIKWLFHWEYTLFSDKPIYKTIATIDTSTVKLGSWSCKPTLQNMGAHYGAPPCGNGW